MGCGPLVGTHHPPLGSRPGQRQRLVLAAAVGVKETNRNCEGRGGREEEEEKVMTRNVHEEGIVWLDRLEEGMKRAL